jgi:hypothetical protein
MRFMIRALLNLAYRHPNFAIELAQSLGRH